MKDDIVMILCKLEMIFLPAFFDIMVHVAVHLPREAELARPVHYRWMYPTERFMGKLKRLYGIDHIQKGQLLRDIYPLNV